MFELVSKYSPSGDQPKAIDELVKETNKPTLVLVHNKILVGQLYGKLKELFPNNRKVFKIGLFNTLKIS